MSEWKEKTIGELTEWYSGGTPRKSIEEFWNGNIPWVTAKNLTTIKISNSDLKITPEGLKSGSRMAEKNDILLLVRGSGLYNDIPVCIVDYPVAFNQDIKALRLKKNTEIDAEYLLYWLNSNKIRLRQILEATGIGAGKLDTELVKSIKVQIPPEIELKEIQATARCLYLKIENLRKQNETLEKIAQTLFKHWFIDFEFPNENGQPYRSSGGAMQPSELGAIPAGWRVGKLGDVVEINAKSINKDYKHKNIEYVDISSVGVGTLESTTPYILKDSPSRARRLVSHGDVIWSGVRPNRKSYLYISHPVSNLVVSTGFITLTPNLIPASYLYGWVTTDTFVDYLTFNASGSAYPAVKPEHFEIAEILLPDETTLNNFHALVDTVREKIFYNSKQIQTLTKTRDTLLPELMSGKLRIPE